MSKKQYIEMLTNRRLSNTRNNYKKEKVRKKVGEFIWIYIEDGCLRKKFRLLLIIQFIAVNQRKGKPFERESDPLCCPQHAAEPSYPPFFFAQKLYFLLSVKFLTLRVLTRLSDVQMKNINDSNFTTLHS